MRFAYFQRGFAALVACCVLSSCAPSGGLRAGTKSDHVEQPTKKVRIVAKKLPQAAPNAPLARQARSEVTLELMPGALRPYALSAMGGGLLGMLMAGFAANPAISTQNSLSSSAYQPQANADVLVVQSDGGANVAFGHVEEFASTPVGSPLGWTSHVEVRSGVAVLKNDSGLSESVPGLPDGNYFRVQSFADVYRDDTIASRYVVFIKDASQAGVSEIWVDAAGRYVLVGAVRGSRASDTTFEMLLELPSYARTEKWTFTVNGTEWELQEVASSAPQTVAAPSNQAPTREIMKRDDKVEAPRLRNLVLSGYTAVLLSGFGFVVFKGVTGK